MARQDSRHIDIMVKDRSVRLSKARLAELIQFVCRREGTRAGQIDLAIVGPEEIESLNRRYLGHPGPTDVLSFDLSESAIAAGEGAGARSRTRQSAQPSRRAGISGQLVVCATVARKQGPLHGLPAVHELMLYIIHGLLHLMGYDDTAIRPAARMHARQDELLKAFLSLVSRATYK